MKGLVGRTAACCAVAVAALLGAFAPAAPAASAPDFSSPGEAWNVLPPGQDGGPGFTLNAVSQLPLYDNLTPRFGNVTDADLPLFFKPNTFGTGGPPAATINPPARPGLTIERDAKNVPHVLADSRADVMYGAGWVTTADRALLMELLRYPGRLAAIDAPGIDPFQIALSFRSFTPSAQTEAFLAQQVTLLQSLGPAGQQIITDVDNYLQGLNDARTLAGIAGPAWTRNDVISVAALVGARFGKGGGDEARRAQFLSELQDRLGEAAGRSVFDDVRQQNDPEHSVSVPGKFKLGGPAPQDGGNRVIDADSIGPAAASAAAASQSSQQSASNALLVGADRSQTGNPLFVAGPQIGYLFPQGLFEMDLHGGGIDARGTTFPGSGPYVQLGRGQDYSWSATSSGTDIIDQFAETLCGGSDTKYVFKGKCLEMTNFSAGTLGPGPGPPAGPVVFNETVHGPVSGYATSDGERVAISNQRSTRGREMASAIGFEQFNSNAVDSAESFMDAASKIEFTFNWFYADNEDIAMFSSGRVPDRDEQVDMGLPTDGTGKYEWKGFEPAHKHPQGISPASGAIVNWNNKPAAEWTSADDDWGSRASVSRNELLEATVAERQTHTLGSLVAAMNKAATQDLRNAEVLPVIKAVLDTGPAPSAREQQMLDLLDQWRTDGSSRLDADLNTRIDAAGAAIMDAAWTRIADAVMSPVLGPQLGDLANLQGRDNRANNQGSAYGSGWYGYVDKDLRTLLGQDVEGPYQNAYCGAGDLDDCRDSLWQALKDAGDTLATQQGTNNPALWRSNALTERIVFLPGLLPFTMRWTNRPTYQQAISYSGHR